MAKTESVVDMDYKEFAGQRDGEEVIVVLFRHWYTLVFPIVRAILIILATLIVPAWLGITGFIFSYGITTLVYYLWQVFWVGVIVYDYFNWYQDRYIITTERIIEIDQRGLFSRRVSEIELDRIQNITHAVDGLPATILNFGTITIQSAGANDLSVRRVGRPAEVQEDITRLVKGLHKPTDTTATKFIRHDHS